MRNARKWLAAGALLSAAVMGGCGGSARSKDLALLEKAKETGVLTQGEYDAKRAALTLRAAEFDGLDKSLAAGTLTPADYRSAKAQLIANGSTLVALENARKLGVLNEEEYLVKKAALRSGEAPAIAQVSTQPAPSSSSFVPPAASQNTAAASSAPSPSSSSSSSPPPSSSPSAASTTTGDSHVLRMKMAAAIDRAGFERPMQSLTMLIPVDWQAQGGTTWNIKDKCNTIQTSLRSTGPDGRGVEFFPAFIWVWADDPKPLQMTAAQTARFGNKPCDIMPPMSATDFLRRNLNRYRPGVQLISFEPAPKLLAALQEQARQGEQMARRYNLKQSIRPDAVRARVRYTLNGQAIEEWIYAATVITATLGPSYNMQTNQMGQAYTYNCAAYARGERALQGKLDASEKLFDLIAGTSRVNPAWQAKVNGNAQAIQAIELKGVRDRSAIITKNAEDISKIRRDSYEYQQRSQDQISFENSQNMRGVERYRNPETGETVDLSNQYGQAWVNNRGEYLLSDQPSFDPSVTFKEEWKPLEKVGKQ